MSWYITKDKSDFVWNDFQTKEGRLTKAKRPSLREWCAMRGLKTRTLMPTRRVEVQGDNAKYHMIGIKRHKSIRLGGELNGKGFTITSENIGEAFKAFENMSEKIEEQREKNRNLFNGRGSNIPEGFDDNGQIR